MFYAILILSFSLYVALYGPLKITGLLYQTKLYNLYFFVLLFVYNTASYINFTNTCTTVHLRTQLRLQHSYLTLLAILVRYFSD